MKTITFRRRAQDGRDRTATLRCEAVVVGLQTVTLATIDPDDHKALGEHYWTAIAWTDEAGQRQERALLACVQQGAELHCSV